MEKRRRRRIVLAVVGLLAAGTCAAGPRPHVDPPRDVARALPLDPRALDATLRESEARFPLRAGTEKTIRWAGEPGQRTRLALVYLHGWSATRREISPVVEDAAAELGANAFFTRLRGHGLDGAAMADAVARDWLEDTREAMAVGRLLGQKVLVVGTSTGGTLATWLALTDEAPDAVVLVAPNFGPRAAGSRFLTWPWLSVALPAVLGSHGFVPRNEEMARLWTTTYPVRAVVPMMALVQHVRGLHLEAIRIPTAFVYAANDDVVDARQTDAVYERLAPAIKERTMIVPIAGEEPHVLAGDICSPSQTAGARRLLVDFARRRIDP